MDISLGFIIGFFLILFPGLIIRRLYYYGEFSKQFDAGHSLIKLIAISSLPGLINLVCIFFFYDKLISHIDLEEIINTFKDINDPQYHLDTSCSKPFNQTINESVLPFLAFLYTSSLLIGSMAGRLIRITRIDTKFKLLRFKNYWFYVFSGELTGFKKMKHMKEVNKRHLFTVADILVDSDDKGKLYSGVVVDYELNETNCQILNKVILQHAERYKMKDSKMERVRIPGNLFVVDCSKMRNINLTYVFEESSSFLESKIPGIIDNTFSILIILLIPFFIFKTDFISWNWYIRYFNFVWYKEIICYLTVIQGLSLLNPFFKNKKSAEYEYIGWRKVGFKVLAFMVYLLIFWLIY
jgi:hypothetical protein